MAIRIQLTSPPINPNVGRNQARPLGVGRDYSADADFVQAAESQALGYNLHEGFVRLKSYTSLNQGTGSRYNPRLVHAVNTAHEYQRFA